MLGKLHHIGMAVPSLDAAMQRFAALPGASVGPEFKIPGLPYRLAYVEIGGAKIELVEPVVMATTAGRYIEKHSDGGVYHIAYEVDDVRATAAAMVAQGAIIVGSAEPRIEGDGHQVLVLDASKTHGTMIELRQPG